MENCDNDLWIIGVEKQQLLGPHTSFTSQYRSFLFKRQQSWRLGRNQCHPPNRSRIIFFSISDELLNANSAVQGRKNQIIFLWSLLISQLPSSWRMPLVSSSVYFHRTGARYLPYLKWMIFQLACSSLAVFPLQSYLGDVEQRFKRFWTIYDVWRGYLSRNNICNNFYVPF